MDTPDIDQMIEDAVLVSRHHDLKWSLFFKIRELKAIYIKNMEKFQEIEKVIEPEKKETTETVKRIDFKMHKQKKGWMIDGDEIPRELIEYILTHSKPGGVIGMHTVKLKGGRVINLSFEKETETIFTGFIMEKIQELKETKQKKYLKPERSTPTDKKEFLETLLIYLDECDDFYKSIYDLFTGKWKPAIDRGIFKEKKVIGR